MALDKENEKLYRDLLKGIKRDAHELRNYKGSDQWVKMRIKIVNELFGKKDQIASLSELID